jgi:glycosyltransferase involved in cell wall biosynthesis
MPSTSEPFGLTALEAVGYGTPVLVTKRSGVSEVLRNCLKVDPWDVNEMASQITSVVQHDPLRDNLIANARLEYDNLSWDDASEHIEQLYGQHLVGATA